MIYLCISPLKQNEGKSRLKCANYSLSEELITQLISRLIQLQQQINALSQLLGSRLQRRQHIHTTQSQTGRSHSLYVLKNCKQIVNRLVNCKNISALVGPRGSAVERQSLASILSPSCARPVADGWPLVGKPSAIGQPTRPTQPFILSVSINE